MYPKNNLFKTYIKNNSTDTHLSPRLPDFSKKYTLKIINTAINCCDRWDNFLDIGAGNGHYSIALLDRFKNGCAVEPNIENEDLHKIEKKYTNYKIYEDYIENIKFDNKFDFIFMSDLFEHIPVDNIEKFISDIAEVQNRGGVVYILTPNTLFTGPAEKSEIHYKKHKDGHYKHYTRKEIKKILKKFDYKLIFATYEEAPLKMWYKNLLHRFSHKDNVLIKKSEIYKILSLPIIYIMRLFFLSASNFVYKNEIKNKDNALDTLTNTMIFKKIK